MPDQQPNPSPVPARWRAWGAVALACAGVWLGRDVHHVPVWVWLAASLGCALAALGAPRKIAPIALAGSLVVLGAGWTHARLHTLPHDHLLHLVPTGEGPVIVRVEGVLTRDAEANDRPRDPLDPPGLSGRTTRLDVHLTRAEVRDSSGRSWRAVSGRLAAFVADDANAGRAGDAVRLTGRLQVPEPPGNPGAPAWHLRSAQRNGAGLLRVPSAALVEPAAAPRGLSAARAAWWRVRGWAQRRASGAIGDDPLVRALVLGARDRDAPDSPESAFARTGLAHLVAISGLHLGILAGGAMVLVRLTGERSRLALVAGLMMVALCLVLVPARPPVVRAAVLFGVVVAGDALGARRDRLTLLAWITLGLIAWRPLDVFGLGLPLTVGVTALLLWMSRSRRFARPGLRSLSREPQPASLRRLARHSKHWAGSTLRVCIACWAIAQPLVLVRGGAVSPLAWLATPVVLPPVALTLGAGYLAAIVGLVWPAAGAQLGSIASVLGGATAGFVRAIDRLPMVSFDPLSPSAWWGAAATLAVIALLAAPRRWRAVTACAVVLACAWGAAESTARGRLGPDVLVRLDTLDVGDGSCHVLRFAGEPEGGAILWDAGSLSGVGRSEEIAAALRALGVRRARTAVVTHPNLDHYNLIPALAPTLRIERVLVTRALLERARARAGPRLRSCAPSNRRASRSPGSQRAMNGLSARRG